MTPRVWKPDWDAFNEYVDRLRQQHEQRIETEAVAISMAAFARWGVEPPAAFLEQHPEARTVFADINTEFLNNGGRAHENL